MQKILIFLYKLFFIGLLLQFFLHTRVTFSWWVNARWMEYVRLWKEWVIGLLGLLTVWAILYQRRWSTHFWWVRLNQLLALFSLGVWAAAVAHFFFVWGEVGAFVMALKYDFLGFALFLVGAHSSLLLEQEQRKSLIERYGKMLKYVLLLALLWYLIIFIKPWTLKLFGYDNFVYEGLVGSAPPAAYYTHINWWIPRNQFLFERPITWGFFLVALWPLFFIRYLWKKPLAETRLWRVIYATNIVVTFSRAARWARIIQLVVLAFFLSSDWKKSLIKYGVPILIAFLGISALGFDQIMNRWYSNYGHMTMLQLGREMFAEQPLRWNGWATAWPWSHRWGIAFNPENQFLQVMIEFGLLWALPRIFMFGWFSIRWVLVWTRKRHKREPDRNLLGLSIGMLWLAICGMVLHSFSDRMVVYPFMLLYGIVATVRYQGTQDDQNNTLDK